MPTKKPASPSNHCPSPAPPCAKIPNSSRAKSTMSGSVSTSSAAGSAASSTARAISSPRSPPERTEEADMDDPKQKQTQRAAAVEAIRKRLQAYDRDGEIGRAHV